MKQLLFVLTLALAACGPNSAKAPQAAANGCALTATHTLTWSTPDAPDSVTAKAEGPSCAQSVVTLVVRKANGDPLSAFASTYVDMKTGGAGAEGLPNVSTQDVQSFLDGWANINITATSDLPAWPESASRPGAESGFSYDTPMPRESYTELRTRALPMLCFASATEGVDCLIIDPATHTPSRIVTYGP